MIEIDIPGFGRMTLEHLVCDYNGTLACDGMILPEVIPLVRRLSRIMKIHIVTADTFGIARKFLSELPVRLSILPQVNQDEGKQAFIEKLGVMTTVCVGNGRNDSLMLKEAALGICLIQAEGANVTTLLNADIVCTSAKDALELLLNPKRLVATLRK
jgi:soluble P-type ATPase